MDRLRKRRYILNSFYGIIALIFSIAVIQFIIGLTKCPDSFYIPTFKNPNKYHYLFRENIRPDLKNIFTAGKAGKGWIYAYNYKDKFRFIIWELYGYKNVNISETSRSRKKNYLNEKKVISSEEIGPKPVIKLESTNCLQLTNQMKAYFTCKKYSVDTLQGIKGLMFSGEMKDINLVNNQGKGQIRYYIEGKELLTYLIFYKSDSSLMIICINPLQKDLNDIDPMKMITLSKNHAL